MPSGPSATTGRQRGRAPSPTQRMVEELVMGVGGLEVRPLYRAAEPRVVEPLAVPRPRNTGELDARDYFREVVSGTQVAQVDVLEVGATRGGGVGEHAAVGGHRRLRHRDRSVRREAVRVEDGDGRRAR